MTDMDTELKRLVLARQIERLISDYAYYIDQNRPDDMAALFTEDCEVSYAPNFGAKGITDYKKTLEGIGTYFKGTTHHVSNVAIDFVSDTEANVRSALISLHRYTKERPDGWLFGQYHDHVVLQNGKWKFKRRELRATLTTDYHVKTSNPIGRL